MRRTHLSKCIFKILVIKMKNIALNLIHKTHEIINSEEFKKKVVCIRINLRGTESELSKNNVFLSEP